MRIDANGGGSVNYEPNSLNGPVRCAASEEPPSQETRLDMITATATMIIREGNLLRLMNPEQRERLFGRYRSTYAGRQCTAGDSVAADLPFLPWAIGPVESALPRLSD
jgi:catalase